MMDNNKKRAIRKLFRDLKGYELDSAIDELIKVKRGKRKRLKEKDWVMKIHHRHEEIAGVTLEVSDTEEELLYEHCERHRGK